MKDPKPRKHPLINHTPPVEPACLVCKTKAPSSMAMVPGTQYVCESCSPKTATVPADKPLDVDALELATHILNVYTHTRQEKRLKMAEEYKYMAEFIIKAEEQYFQSLKNKVAKIIEGATRIA